MDSSQSHYYHHPPFSANSAYSYTSATTGSTIMGDVIRIKRHVRVDKLTDKIATAENNQFQAKTDIDTANDCLERKPTHPGNLIQLKDAQERFDTATHELNYLRACLKMKHLEDRAEKPNDFVAYVMEEARDIVKKYQAGLSEEKILTEMSSGGDGKDDKTTKKDQ